MFKDDPQLECNWNNVLSIYNSSAERNRVNRINPNLRSAVYPLTREFLNNYFDQNKFSFSSFNYTFYPDCASSMYSFFIMTFGYTPGTTSGGSNAMPAIPGGAGISYGLNPFFGLFNIDSPILWILLIALGVITVKKIID